MLILARRVGEAIIIAGALRLEVTETFDRASCTVQISGPPELVPITQTVRLNVGESFRIAEQIVVTLLQIRSSGIVRIGFEGDRSIPIDREEVHLAALQS